MSRTQMLVVESDLPPVGSLEDYRRSRERGRAIERELEHPHLTVIYDFARYAARARRRAWGRQRRREISKLGANAPADGRPVELGGRLRTTASPKTTSGLALVRHGRTAVDAGTSPVPRIGSHPFYGGDAA